MCEDYAAISCPVFAVGGWTDGYTNAIPRLLEHLTVPRKGLIGPWAHGFPHVALPGPRIGFLQEALRWWDHWLKRIDTGVMAGPMLRAWMTESVAPAPHHARLPGRWIAETAWPPANVVPHRLHLADAGLTPDRHDLTPRDICSPQTLGRRGGAWCPFGQGADQAGDQRDDDAASLLFETAPLDGGFELLGAPVVTLELAADRSLANLIVRLCDLRPDGISLRVSYGVCNLAHRDGHEMPEPLVPGRRYRVRIQLNDAGSMFPAGHRVRLALSTTYWPMIWPPPETATVTVFGGTLDLPARQAGPADDRLPAFEAPETAPPEATSRLADGSIRIDRLGLELKTRSSFDSHIDPDDPLSAVVDMRQAQTVARDGWRVRIETAMRLACTRDAFLLRASLRAYEGEVEVSRREWDTRVPRALV